MDFEEFKAAYPDCATFKFGDSEDLCARLLSLVRAGKKVATCGALRDYESENEPLPEVGQVSVALNWDGAPTLAIKTIDVSFIKFCDVDEDFALAEGENESLEGWRVEHRGFFERNGRFDSEMILVCERFKLIADFI